ncbi:PTS transporter subunit EIIC [Mesomycoplasma neurolyticum]|uniref:EIICBA-Glc 2 n=1 Tax=Mesomycoplasma neurolyticum TaxID=2120 RepID=A0A449A6H8_9BACT|nr:PTS transporter subunit EIIC [Mesomycoplasma neurolyticum]VEU59832.1 EIICBA-Glc 2 [Mesomycoplasma neurolyticum]
MTKTVEIKTFFNKFLNQLQRLGKSIMFPIAVLPIAALLLRIGSLIEDPYSNNSENIAYAQKIIGQIISAPGKIVFENLSLIFAIGIAFGFAKDNRGEAALVGAIVWLGYTALLRENVLPNLIWSKVSTFEVETIIKENEVEKKIIEYKSQLLYFLKNGEVKYQLDTGVFGGIISGAIVAKIYNKFKDVKLPTALSFFGGRRFIPMLGILAIVPLAFVFAIIWPLIQFILIKLGTSLSSQNGFLKGFFAGIYALFNRLLQPFGLHHIINTFVWFQLPIEGTTLAGVNETINGDIVAFQKGLINSGTFTSGFFPLFLGGLPGAALAMILTTNKAKRKQMMYFYGGAALVSWLTGIDEPLIFAFIFISPLLYLANAFLTAIFYMFVTWTGSAIGIGFSAGFIDYLVSFPRSWQIATKVGVLANPLWIWVFSAIMFAIYFVVFYFSIKKFDIKIPGRENEEITYLKDEFTKSKLSTHEHYYKIAKAILKTIKKENIEIVENCATRLRLTLKSNSKDKIDDKIIIQSGARGVVRLGNKGYQIIIGTDVEKVADILKDLMKNDAN